MAAISTPELFSRLAKGKPIPAILLFGADSYLREVCRRKLVDAYVAEESRDWGVRKFSADDDDVSSILGQAQTMPMLAPMQVIFVSETQAWDRLGEDAREALVKQIAAYLDKPAPFTVLVFEASALDQRMRLAKTLAEKTLTVSVELSSDPAERARLAVPLSVEMASELGAKLEPDAAENLCDLLNGDLASIRTEVEKLAAYAGERKNITRADVDLLVISSRKYEVWDLAGMLSARQPDKALEFLDELLRAGEAAPALVGALAWTFRKLLEAQELPAGTNGWQAAGRLKMRADAAELAVRQSRKFPRAQLTSGLAALYEADSRLKSGGTNQRAVMEFLVTQLASPNSA
ncbi:MAG TPA: DNA polymerase III subunit delta [Candidatus Acidoferrales bacterium]|jgi:DNA polymerase-3 subunit delta|nr:DNA polymerase III subunit delta [Candidatus Acidoferrales bacterium]